MSQTSGTRFSDLRRDRDEAIRRAVEAERFSRKEEVDALRDQLHAEASAAGVLAGRLYLTRELMMELAEGYVNIAHTVRRAGEHVEAFLAAR